MKTVFGCAKLIDTDEATYTAKHLKMWKKDAEEKARQHLEQRMPKMEERNTILLN